MYSLYIVIVFFILYKLPYAANKVVTNLLGIDIYPV